MDSGIRLVSGTFRVLVSQSFADLIVGDATFGHAFECVLTVHVIHRDTLRPFTVVPTLPPDELLKGSREQALGALVDDTALHAVREVTKDITTAVAEVLSVLRADSDAHRERRLDLMERRLREIDPEAEWPAQVMERVRAAVNT